MTGNQIYYFGIADNITPLPVELVYFEVSKLNENEVNLKWITVQEIENIGFQIEMSTDNQSWISKDFVEGHFNSFEPHEYNYPVSIADEQSPVLYFRLKQTDNNGNFEY